MSMRHGNLVSFRRAVYDARHDPFVRTNWIQALIFTIRHWRWLNSHEGPYGEWFI